jgi:2,4-dienoyl-CoA reductase-like NADH-dependent reductase (Old Yellow Enzyme family)/thioredoxin reductase
MAGELKILFSPFIIGRMELKNRLAMAPIGGVYPSLEGFLRPELGDFILTRARGGVGMIILADAGVGFTSLDAEVMPEILKKMITAARELVKAVHQEGVRIGVQLHHSGRQLDFPTPGSEVVGPSPIPWSRRAPIPRELTPEEIENLIRKYVTAAVRVKDAGFDFVEVKACHGYLLGSFLSPLSNRRNDQYGGNLQNRARLTMEIIRRIKKELGQSLLISCRFNGSDHIDGGMGLKEAQELSLLLIKEGADFLNISAGVYGSYPVIVPPYDAPPGCYLPLVEAIKKGVNVPVIAVGRINDPRLGEEILRAGKADIIAMGRALLADPDLPLKAREGRFEDIRKCIACNQGCQDKLGGTETTCLVNPEAAKERLMSLIPAPLPKKVLVVGGGPGGMEAARISALRGHKVHLYEKNKEVGGQWKLAAIPPGKEGFADLTSYLLAQLQKLGVKLHLGTRVTEKILEAENADVIVMATGATPVTPNLEAAPEDLIMAGDVLSGKIQTGERILVVGGNALGLEVAAFLALRGKKVEVVEMMDSAGRDLGPTVRWHLRHKLNELNVKISSSTKVRIISRGTVTLADQENRESCREVDSVVIAAGSRSNDRLAKKFRSKAREFYVIGDALKPRNGLFAVREGTEVGRKI